MDKKDILKKVKEKLAKNYSNVDFRKFIKALPKDIKEYLNTEFQNDSLFVPQFLTFVDTSFTQETSITAVGPILKQLVAEGIATEQYIQRKLNKKKEWMHILFGDKYINIKD